jgi:exopolysaccharide biosynthesis polyprenyl glycosylphosphotransferase
MTSISTDAKRALLLRGLKLFDLGLLLVSYGLATVLVVASHPGPTLAEFLALRVKLGNLVLFSAVVLLWHVIFYICGMYGSMRLSSRLAVVLQALKSATLCSASLVAVARIFTVKMVTPRFLLLFWALGFLSLSCGRLLLRYALSGVRLRGHNLRNLLILGTNQRAISFARSIAARPELGYRIMGFVDEEWSSMDNFKIEGHPLVASLATLPEFLRHNIVDEVANYLPLRTFYEHAAKVAALCELHGIILRYDSDIFGLKNARSRLDGGAGDQHITCYPGRWRGWPVLVKRVFDFVGALTLLILFSPLLLIVAVLLKLSSDGPIFFRQERIGYNKRRFRIYKFRTMVQGAEQILCQLEELNEVSGPVFKIKNDPRITPLGKFLRRSSIDELPQLFNVLLGDMSLVGPRPMAVRDYQGFNEDWQRRRFSLRPGMTCLWQVNGRSSITFEQWMKLDLQYMDEWSLWLDLKILVRTIPAVFSGSGAS